MSERQKSEIPAVKPVRFVHVKSGQFRSYHADGAWSVMNAHGDVNVNFFLEFPKLADEVIIPIGPDGKLTTTSQLIGAGENDPNHYVVTRDMQCSVVLSPLVAMNLRDQLDFYIKATEASLKSLPTPPVPEKKT